MSDKVDLGVQYEPFRQEIVNAVDTIVLAAKKNGSYSGTVQTEADWKTMSTIVKVWSILFPDDYKSFIKNLAKVKSSLKNRHASNKEGEAVIQHQLSIPELLYILIRSVFPHLKWDKKFVAKFAKRYKMFKVPESIL